MRIVKINDLRKESPRLATRKNANSGQTANLGVNCYFLILISCTREQRKEKDL
jgi:hypothetical protein